MSKVYYQRTYDYVNRQSNYDYVSSQPTYDYVNSQHTYDCEQSTRLSTFQPATFRWYNNVDHGLILFSISV